MDFVEKKISGETCKCYEYVHPVDGPSGKMRLLLNGVFEGDIERETVMLVPLFLEESELAAIGDLWLTEQEKELGLPLGESCASSGWWVGSSDASRDREITEKYNFLVPMALAVLGAQDMVHNEIDRLYGEQEKLQDALAKEYEAGESDWAVQLEVKIEDLERLIAEREELLKHSKMLTIGCHVEYCGHPCEVVSTEYNTIYLQCSNNDLHWELPAARYLKDAGLWEENDREVAAGERDSLGNSLSGMQEAFFKDSRVRDERGRLMVMYHGTPNGDFASFKPGCYFTSDREYAEVYESPGASSICPGKEVRSPQTFAVYLNIRKPFDIRNAEARAIYINDYIKGGNAIGINPYLSDAEYGKIQSIDWTEGMDLMEFLLEKGYNYDGMILDEGGTGGYGFEVKLRGMSYVNFYEHQVKAIDNKIPTSCPEFRCQQELCKTLTDATIRSEQTFEAGANNKDAHLLK